MPDIIIANTDARVNVTWGGQNGDLPDPVAYDTPDEGVRYFVTEAVRGGGVPGIAADPAADFSNYVVDRFNATAETPYNRLMVRPKTPFGKSPVHGKPAYAPTTRVVIRRCGECTAVYGGEHPDNGCDTGAVQNVMES